MGDARLQIETDLAIVPLAFVRAADGTLSAMHDTVRGASVGGSDGYTYAVPIFNPASDATQVSRLRLINPGDAAAAVTIGGRDDSGAVATGGDVTLMLAAGGAQTLTAQQLEAGDTAITGQLGAGTGKWRLTVSSDQPLQVVNIVAATAGYWNNLSTTAVPGAAPADLESLNERFVGNAVVYVTGSRRFTLNAQTGERFTETAEIDGVSTTYMGSYDYAGIGPEEGRLTLTYDDGDVCAANLYFSTHTAGWFASHCTGSDYPADGTWLGGSWSVEDDEDDGGEVTDTMYGVDDMLPGVPASGQFEPATTSGASVTATADGTTIELNDGGYFELSDGTRYTCTATDGCSIANGTVTQGTVAGRAAGDGEVDRFPSFRGVSNPGAQTYTVGTAIDALTLPEGSGGNGTLAYSLSPNVPGLTFDATARQLTGTPSTAGTNAMTYTVTDEDGDTDTLSFTITVNPGTTETGSLGECYVSLSVSIGQSCTYPGTTDAFSVNERGRGSFLTFLAGIRIRLTNSTINGRIYDFEASHQGDGVWRIDRIAGSSEVPETPPMTGGGGMEPEDTSPSFAADAGPGNQTYTVGTAIATLTLPEASGGDGTLTYSLSPNMPGLTFSATTRQLSGTPTTAASYNMTYTVTDDDGDTDAFNFAITVASDTSTGMDGEAQTGLLALSGCTDGRYVDDPSANPGLVGDCRAVVGFANALAEVNDLPDDHILRQWGMSEQVQIGSWIGIGVSGGRVTRLSLNSKQLTGPIPSEIGGLTALQFLNLAGNQLTGAIPTELASLTGLQSLGLSYNRLTGPIPSEFGGLTALQSLDLGSNQLTGPIPSEFGGLTALQSLFLGYNQLTGPIPTELASLTGLQSLVLRDNRLSGPIPQELGGLTALQVLHLGGNQLTGPIPSEFGALTALQFLSLGFNQLTGPIPSEFGALTALQSLYLVRNELTGPIPTELASLTGLQVLRLSRNRLSGPIPRELGGLSALQELSLGRNELTGPIPTELASLTGLQTLYLATNELTGPIPTELASLTGLQSLYLGFNELTGPIPRELGGLTALQVLHLGYNQLTGAIPQELGGLTALQVLHLGGNQLTGAVPAELGALINLTLLDLSSNALTDISLLALNAQWGDGVQIHIWGNPLNDESLDTHIPALMARGVAVSHDVRLADEFPDSRLVHVYNDNVIVMQVDGDLTAPPTGGSLATYAADFYGWFEDDFDYLLFVSNLPTFEDRSNFYYAGTYSSVMNDTDGIGASKYLDSRFGSAGRLRGVVHFPDPTSLQYGPSLHELLHAWANFTVPTANRAHWGFSSANGQLGGFDIANLVDLGGGRWSAGHFDTFANHGNSLPYSPIELYLAGLLPREEVPDLWMAEDGEWLLDEFGQQVSTDDGDLIFTSDNVQTVSIADIVAEHGERDPPMAERPHQRAAVIFLVDDDHLPNAYALQTTSEHAAWLSFPGNDEISRYNYYEATGGRGTLTLDGLSGVRKSEAAGPADLPASFGVPPPPRLTTMDELCGGYVQTALMDGLSSKHKAPATRVVSLCNASPSGSFEVVRYPWPAPGEADDPGARDSLVPSR